MHRELKRFLPGQVLVAGFEPQEFNVSRLPAGLNWTFDSAVEVMDQCQGALVIAVPRYEMGRDRLMPSTFADSLPHLVEQAG